MAGFMGVCQGVNCKELLKDVKFQVQMYLCHSTFRSSQSAKLKYSLYQILKQVI